MEFFLIIFAVIAVNIIAAAAKRARDSGGDEPQDSDFQPDSPDGGFEDARRFVDEIKRRNAARRADARGDFEDFDGENSDVQDSDESEQTDYCDEDEFGNEPEDEARQPRQPSYPQGGFQNGDSWSGGYSGAFGGISYARQERDAMEERHAAEIAALEKQIAALNMRNSSLERELERAESSLNERQVSGVSRPADLLRAPESLRAAFVASEILSKPISIRKE